MNESDGQILERKRLSDFLMWSFVHSGINTFWQSLTGALVQLRECKNVRVDMIKIKIQIKIRRFKPVLCKEDVSPLPIFFFF